jgi:hypothetical protein
VLVPCAIVVLAAILVLGRPLADAFLRPDASESLWPLGTPYILGGPEPLKHARFAIALAGPVLLAAAILVSGRRRIELRDGAIRALVLTGQLLALVVVIAALLGMRHAIFPMEAALRPVYAWPIFGVPTLVVALVLVPTVLLVMRDPRAGQWVARATAETRRRRIACLVAAGVLTTCWLLTTINSEGTIGNAAFSDLPPWAMADTFAILDGRTSMVDFYAFYGEVWAYVAAVPMYVLGATITVFSIVMASISGLSLLAVYAVLRRVARSSLLALLLFAPVLATGFLRVPGVAERPATNAQIFSVWPMRYAGPYFLAWLTVRHVDGAAPRRVWPLFLVAGLGMVNNLEFGLGAFPATLAALVCAAPPRSRRAALRLASEVAGGLLGALGLVVLVTLVRAGALPDFGFLLEYPRIFGATGYAALPMPTAGFHLVLYATFAATIGVAAVRFVKHERDLLTSMLAWIGIFGLPAGSYFAGRSDLVKLVALFSAWSLALALLVVVVVRDLAAREWRRPDLAGLLVLFGFGIAVASLHELPTPWSQVTRLGSATATPLYAQTAAKRFVATHTRRGERVAILIAMGHRLARDLDLVNVTPFSYIQMIVTQPQMQIELDTIRREHATKLFVRDDEIAPGHRAFLTQAGFAERAAQSGYSEWSSAPDGS